MPPEAAILAVPFGIAFAVSMAFGPGLIAALKSRGVGQVISEDGPESHRAKAGTPTMGGLIILAGVLAASVYMIWAWKPSSASPSQVRTFADLAAVLALMCAFALLGLLDDYLTIRPRRGVRGISSKPKALVQLLLTVGFLVWLAASRSDGFAPVLRIGGAHVLGGTPYWIFAVVYIVGMANFINIADGLDGLVSGLTAIAGAAFVGILALVYGGFESVALFSLLTAVVGACAAFLWFNANPAKVFMGDTGSLALGAALPAIAVLTHREVLMAVIGLVFIVDGFSTVIQWAVFKYTRITTGSGRRVFRKSPIHHHFELGGWPEQRVVVRFWVMGIVAAAVGFAGAAWRLW